ncbi:MAG: flagellar filament capping protein FliD [Gemmatimonadaceae bacterium]|nr:flagellar filament capping protein FliD [Gemmatimonadaceae bacterium]
MASTTTSTTTSTGLGVSGLSSGIQWGDIVDSTIKAYEARILTPINTRLDQEKAQKEAWTTLNGLVDTLNTAARALRTTGFGGYTATVPASPTTSRTLLNAAASTTATPGQYRVEVLQLADTAKISGGVTADTAAARGLTGDFTVNGKTISIVASDSLSAIRDKINSAGAGVTASVVSDGGTAGHLVLTANAAGSSGLAITDGTGGAARELGFLDSRSKPISSAVQAAAIAMGLNVSPPPASIRIGSQLITVDLATMSISAIAARINAAGGSASVQSEAYGDETRFRLVVDGNVAADPNDANSQAVIDALGMAAGSTGDVRQTVSTAAYTDGSNAIATASTALAGIKVGGVASGLAVGDAINIRGMRGDGTAVTIGLVVKNGDTMQTLLDRLNDATSGFGSGTRPATASIGADGAIRLTDSTGGSSRLSMTMSITRADGTTGSLGASSVSVAGRARQLQTGQDAIVNVDGTTYTRTTNTITDAISGVTLSLVSSEPGTTVDVTVGRDTDGAAKAVQTFVDAYNAVRKFYDEQGQTDAVLYANSGLRRVVSSFTDALRTNVSSNTTYSYATLAGVTLDRFGRLSLDSSKFKTALNGKPDEITALFGFSGIGGAFVTATDKAQQYGVGAISQSINNLTQNAVKLNQRAAEAQKKLDAKRALLVDQYTKMEEALSKLQSQSNSFLGSIKGLQGNN